MATAWLDRPERGNALSAAAVDELSASVAAAIDDAAVHTLVFRGRGRHFCTGFDLSGLEGETDATLRERFVRLERLLQAVWHAPVRTVAFATGRAWGAGADLFASCDIRACAPDATFRFPGSAFGIVLGTRRLAELIGWDRARPLVSEGTTLDAAGAMGAGLATDLVDGDAEAWLAARCAPPVADRSTLAAIREATRPDHRAADLATLDRSASRPGLVRRIDDYREGLAQVSDPGHAGRSAGIAAALSAALLFGIGTPLAKLLLDRTDPWMLAALLYLGSGTGLALARLARRSPPVRLAPGEWPWLAAAIFFGGVVGPVLLMAGLARLNASVASLLLNAESVLTALLAWFVFRENFDRRIALGMLAIVAGAVVLSWPSGNAGAAAATPLWPALAVVGACLAWAVDNNLTRKVSLADASFIAMVKGLAAGGTNLVLALAFGASLPGLAAAAGGVLVGFASYGASLVLFVVALRHLGTARTGAYFSVAPFFGATIAVAALGEPLTAGLAVSGALMALGVWLHLTESHGHLHEHPEISHDHEHTHDDGHHDPGHAGHEGPVAPGTRHAHAHRHEPMAHVHEHFPDAHHRHEH